MIRAFVFVAAVALVAPVAAAPKGGPACTPQRPRSYARLADLPAGARALLNLRMAERGQPFQGGDVREPGPNLPSTRFISARETGCRLTVNYEQGGFGYSRRAAVLERRGNRWFSIRSR